MSDSPPVVAVFNTSPDTVNLLRIVFEAAGFVVVSAFTYDIRDGHVDLLAFMTEHCPDVVVYDIAPPYDANWRLFQHLKASAALRNSQCVLTSTNAALVQKMIGSESLVYEFVGKPYDLNNILRAAQEARAAGRMRP